DFYLGLQCPSDLLGSDAAEIFFSKIGSMVGQERSYDLIDMLHNIGILNRLAHFECKEDGPLLARAHKKQEHIWSELNHNESMPKANLDAFAKMDKIESDLWEEYLAHVAQEEDSDNEANLSDIRRVVDSLLDEQVTLSPVVSIDSDKCMSKSTLVSQMNGNPTLSKDIFTRVCQGIYYSKKEVAQATSMTIFLE
ncbi:hypothetical protein L7F22_055304, partial [Adiantum nelumboides]|nr:hypothetical protein [Adiantum nelumboides]